MKFITKIKLRLSKKTEDDDNSSSTEEERDKTPARNSVARGRSVTPSHASEINNLTRLAEREMSEIFSSTQQSPNTTTSSGISVMTPSQINSMERPGTPNNRPVTPALRRVMTDSFGETNRANAGTPFVQGMVGRILCQVSFLNIF